jgi:branched-chain amino acid transport system ATP-binding protein
LLERVGVGGYADERADSIPTGTARLLELARALACDPRLLLLDEPSSGLDESETDDFGCLLRDLAGEGRAVLMVEHDMDLVMSVCDEIHVLDFGRVVASGPPAEIRANQRVQEAYLGYSEEEPASRPASAVSVVPPAMADDHTTVLDPVTAEIPAVRR